MKITASMVKELREMTGAGMLDCKKALQETNGDMEAAVDWLRENGIAKAAKKASRIAAEGLASVLIDKNTAVIFEINSETDFVAKNEQFQNLVKTVGQHLLSAKPKDMEAALKSSIEGKDLATFIAEAAAKIGEKITLRRFEIVEKTDNDVFGDYIHMGGKIAVLVVLEGCQDVAGAKDIAMHVAAMAPQFIAREDIPNEYIEHERQIQTEIVKNDPKTADKPEKVMDGIIEGKLNKQLKDVCLLEQPFVKNPDQTVKAYADSLTANVRTMIRYEVGEGIDKKEVDFADEVMSQVTA
jgi:elongation factor Ts